MASVEKTRLERDSPSPAIAESLPVVSLTQGRATLQLDAEWVTGLLAPWNGRARVALLALLNGQSLRMAAITAGMSVETLRRMRAAEPEYQRACQQAEDVGFGRVFESELYDRALDREDRGSMRALELVVKARSADYREKAQLQLSVVHAAQDSISAAGGWKQLPEGEESK